jgi:hypothetical protein
MPLPRFLSLLLGLSAASTVGAVGFDTPEDAVRALDRAYVKKTRTPPSLRRTSSRKLG